MGTRGLGMPRSSLFSLWLLISVKTNDAPPDRVGKNSAHLCFMVFDLKKNDDFLFFSVYFININSNKNTFQHIHLLKVHWNIHGQI